MNFRTFIPSEDLDQPARLLCLTESSLGALRIGKDAKFLHADNKDRSDYADAQSNLSLCLLTCQKVRFLPLRLLFCVYLFISWCIARTITCYIASEYLYAEGWTSSRGTIVCVIFIPVGIPFNCVHKVHIQHSVIQENKCCFIIVIIASRLTLLCLFL